MSQERREKDRKRDDLSISSVNSSLTDENLEKEEMIRTLKKKIKVLKAGLLKEQGKTSQLELELKSLKAGAATISPGNFTYKGAPQKVMSEEDLQAIKEKYEKDAFQSKQ